MNVYSGWRPSVRLLGLRSLEHTLMHKKETGHRITKSGARGLSIGCTDHLGNTAAYLEAYISNSVGQKLSAQSGP